MMKNKLWSRILSAVTLIATLLALGFFAVLIAAFAGGGKFYTPMLMVITGFLMVFVILKVFQIVAPKVLRIMFLSFLGICVIVVGVYEINQAYQRSFATVNEQGVNLEQYQPFKTGTKAVRLEEESTLNISSDLPKMDGATALYPLYAAFAQATYPASIFIQNEYNIYHSEVMCSTTVGAYKNLFSGEADIIFAARPSKEQLDQAEKKGLELKLTPIGREAFVFFVNSKNNVNDLSTAQIQDIYSGEIRNWSEVGGNNKEIKAFQRPENSGSQTMLQKLMEGKELMMPPKEDVIAGMGGIIERTASYRNYNNAIGYSFLFFATEMIQNNEIKLLKVDGIEPNRSTIKSQAYPLSAEFYAITAGSTNPNLEPFIEWILSPQGQSIVEKTGYTALSDH